MTSFLLSPLLHIRPYHAPLIAPILGVSAGVTLKLFYEDSIFNNWHSFELGKFKKISEFCDSLRFRGRTVKEVIILISMSEFLPAAIATIEHVGKLLNAYSINESMFLGGKFFLSTAGFSLIHIIPVTFISIASLKFIFKKVISCEKIDPSGHVCTALINTAMRSKILQIITKLGFQSYTYIGFCSLMAIAETVWVYDTSVNYHSAADVVTGLAFSIFTTKIYFRSVDFCLRLI